jgi:hypothetical protein
MIIHKMMAVGSQPALLEPLSKEMSDVLTAMQIAVRPENALLLREMAAKLSELVEHQDEVSAPVGSRMTN